MGFIRHTVVRLLTASVLGAGLFLLPTAGSTAAASGSEPLTACANGASGTTSGLFSLEQARACAPGAPVVAASTRLAHDGTYIVERGKGYEILSRSTKPDTSRKAGDPCFEGTATVLDGGGIIEWLGAELCYNYSVAWAYNVQSNCTVILPGFWCLGRYQGTFGNYTSLAGAWGNYYNLAGPFQMNTGIRLDIQPNGHWWAWSYDCSSTC